MTQTTDDPAIPQQGADPILRLLEHHDTEDCLHEHCPLSEIRPSTRWRVRYGTWFHLRDTRWPRRIRTEPSSTSRVK